MIFEAEELDKAVGDMLQLLATEALSVSETLWKILDLKTLDLIFVLDMLGWLLAVFFQESEIPDVPWQPLNFKRLKGGWKSSKIRMTKTLFQWTVL